MGTMVAEVQAGWVSCICPHWQCQGPNGTKLQTKGIAVIVIVIILAIDIIAIVVTIFGVYCSYYVNNYDSQRSCLRSQNLGLCPSIVIRRAVGSSC